MVHPPAGGTRRRARGCTGRCPWRRARRCPRRGCRRARSGARRTCCRAGWRPRWCSWRPRWRPRCGRTNPGLRRGRRQAWPRGDRPERDDEAVEGGFACVRAGARDCRTLTDTTVDRSGNPTCVRSVICMSSNGQGISWNVNPSGLYNGTNNVRRVQWRSNPLNLGYKPDLSLHPDPGRRRRGLGRRRFQGQRLGGAALAGRGRLRSASSMRAASCCSRLATAWSVTCNKAHGMNVDANDNAYFADPSGAVIMQGQPRR